MYPDMAIPIHVTPPPGFVLNRIPNFNPSGLYVPPVGINHPPQHYQHLFYTHYGAAQSAYQKHMNNCSKHHIQRVSGIIIPVRLNEKNPITMDNHRGIAVTPDAVKLFECTILPSLTENFKQSTLKLRFTKGMSLLMASLITKARAEVKHLKIEPLYQVTGDSQKSFDVVDHIMILS
ncbi:CBLL1 [Mytilus coruscus]|uniref:CBLL1 n=1 Tax=Mytilus coruscus TaxID=42192 RepID=A0A6J8C160_MYTCO|nr:CBLL1 [Mytilus coruscus]